MLVKQNPAGAISTHTPLARRDAFFPVDTILISLFLLTRLLRGVTRMHRQLDIMHFSFLLTRLLRGVTIIEKTAKKYGKISTHTPLARRDNLLVATSTEPPNFYSHASCEA